MNEEKKITYVDEEGKTILGGSILDLQRNTDVIEKQSKILICGIVILSFFLLLTVYVLYQIMRYDILTNIVDRCVC